ncbi:MAG: N-acetylmuramoyl-L-alanine amidase [Elusimicrobia bacterium]|nr:N-acetylmuramoyl-L-alanine amidase [Elusimicrobiota bacterium]
MGTRIAALIPAAALLLASAPVEARPDAAAALLEDARAFGLETGIAIPMVVAVSTPPTDGISVEEGLVNYDYAEMVDKMEGMSRTVIGRNKKKRKISTGVTPADRVDRGEIKYIVLHASGGATGKPGSCDGSVSWLLKQKTAAHFMVCRDGRVIRMVKIENIANHVKNGAIDAASVGIETESGHPEKKEPFLADDWNPAKYWRMYASMAWLVRAIAKETNLPRDRAHVITHEESDRGMRDAHTDPGPFFNGAAYTDFDARFPGQAVTPREYLMRLVADDTPPQIWLVSAASDPDVVEIKDTNELGLAHIRVWKLDAAGKPKDLMYEWSAPVAGMPTTIQKAAIAQEPGSYRVVARDLVGNTSAALVRVPEGGAAPTLAAAPVSSPESVLRE